MIQLRPVRESDIPSCERLLRGLPEWFGLEEANRNYIGGLRELPSVVALQGEEVVGFVSIRDHGFGSAEIDVMAVAREAHRQGIGRQMVDWATNHCRQAGFTWLHVKTRGPSTPDPHYERTRNFWESVGFARLFESLTHWGPEDAALVLVMALGARSTDRASTPGRHGSGSV